SLAADADLDEHEVRAVDGAVEVLREVERPAELRAVEHPPGERSDHVEPLRVDVVQRERVDGQGGQAGDELGRVGRAGADDSDLHPFTPVSVTPSTNARCARKNSTITGAMTSSVAAIVRFHCTWCSDRYCERPSDTTQ